MSGKFFVTSKMKQNPSSCSIGIWNYHLEPSKSKSRISPGPYGSPLCQSRGYNLRACHCYWNKNKKGKKKRLDPLKLDCEVSWNFHGLLRKYEFKKCSFREMNATNCAAGFVCIHEFFSHQNWILHPSICIKQYFTQELDNCRGSSLFF